MDELFAQSDIVSIHALDTPATRNMIGAHQLALLRDSTTSINTARQNFESRGTIGRMSLQMHRSYIGRNPSGTIATRFAVLGVANLLLRAPITGHGEAGLFQIGEKMRQALHDVLAERLVQGAVPLERWEFLA